MNDGVPQQGTQRALRESSGSINDAANLDRDPVLPWAEGPLEWGLPSQAQFKARRGRQVESNQHQRPVLSRSGSQWTRGALHQDKRHHTSSITVVATSGAGPVRQGAHYRPSPAAGHRTGYREPLPSRFGRRALLGGRPSRGLARSAGVCRCSKWVSATPEAPSARHTAPHAGLAPQQGSRKPGPRYAQGLRVRTFLLLLLTCEVGGGGPARAPGRRHTVLRGLGNTRLSTISPAATSRQKGGRPASPAAVGRLPLKRRSVPRPSARPLTRSVQLPALTRRQAPSHRARRPSPTGSARLALGSARLALGSAGARVTHTGPRSRSPSICPGGWPRITGEV
ncbi:hypothetical protein NDU88_005519 [Pleurodeles waltl]|uniref:Uncharacterized protein n=1 Tax=Pleurodeles waltl TaxID=8319 RepID=A0AAV7RIR9_PLEWA|nr:hypothetical protein NDU88_005519 [Pleurodeles waltl]